MNAEIYYYQKYNVISIISYLYILYSYFYFGDIVKILFLLV